MRYGISLVSHTRVTRCLTLEDRVHLLQAQHECFDRGYPNPCSCSAWLSRVGVGAGKALGIGTGVEGFVILGVFALIWALYYISSRDLGDGRGQGDDSGLSL